MCSAFGEHVVPADRVDAQHRVADEVADVDADTPVVERQVVVDRAPVPGEIGLAIQSAVEIREVEQVPAATERRVRVAVHADELGRDALAHLGLVARLGEDHQRRMRMQVDEPGRHDEPGRIDRASRPGVLSVSAAQEDQPVGLDRHGARESRCARAIDHGAIRDGQIVGIHGRRLACRVGPTRDPVLEGGIVAIRTSSRGTSDFRVRPSVKESWSSPFV